MQTSVRIPLAAEMLPSLPEDTELNGHTAFTPHLTSTSLSDLKHGSLYRLYKLDLKASSRAPVSEPALFDESTCTSNGHSHPMFVRNYNLFRTSPVHSLPSLSEFQLSFSTCQAV